LDLSPACPKCEADARIVRIADGVSIVCSRCPFVAAYPNIELGAVTASVFRAVRE
jgi:ribosomal protein L37AE/L43A